jgi:WD40 repeat protein/serine/threonine protein kinase
MGEATQNHPTDQELQALSVGQLPEAELSRVLAHLGNCPACCSRLDHLAATDPLLARLQERAAHRNESLITPNQRRSAVRALRHRHEAGAATRTQVPPAEPVLLPAPKQVGDYDILAEVGRGGMGVVYKARHRSLHRLAAVKMVLAGEFASAAQVLRFRLEAELAARVPHPNIVQLYEIGTHDGRPFLAMEWVEGGSLAERLDGKPWPPDSAAALVETLARAIHVAHGEGVVHRDLKPANILLQIADCRLQVEKQSAICNLQSAIPKIADFGLAQPTDGAATLTQSGYLVGTPGYMAPEQASGRRALVGPATDVYALGVVLYQLLTGQLPFQGDSALEVLRAVMADEPLRPRHWQAQLPRDLEMICLKCLAKEPGRRYADAQELAEDLRRWQAHEPIRARPSSALYQLRQFARRHKALVGAVTVTFLVLVAGIISTGIFALQATEQQRRADDRRREGRRVVYVANIRLAQRAWELGKVVEMRRLFAEAAQGEPGDEDLRGFEWYYLERLARPREQMLLGHRREVRRVAFSPDGRRLASCDVAGEVRLWDAATGQLLRSLSAHSKWTMSVAFSPDGRRLASGGGDSLVRVWNVETGEMALTLKGHRHTIYGVAYSPDGQFLASIDDTRAVRVWEAATGRLCYEVNLPSHLHGMQVAFSPDSRRLAIAASPDKILVWDAATGRELRAWSVHVNWLPDLAWAPDGRCLASAGSDGVAKVWNVDTGTELAAFRGHADYVAGVAFSPDGRFVASASRDGMVRVWAADTGREAVVLKGHENWVLGVAFSPDGRRLATASQDGTVRLWQLASGQDGQVVPCHTGIIDVVYSPDGQLLAVEHEDGQITLRRADTGQSVLSRPGQSTLMPSTGLAFHPDGRRLASIGQRLSALIWDAKSGHELLGFKATEGRRDRALAFDPSGRRLATAGEDVMVHIWDADTGRETLVLRGYTKEVYGVAFSPDGRHLASCGRDHAVRVWDAASGEERLTLAGQSLANYRVAFSPDGRRLASAGEDQDLHVWDAESGRQLFAARGHSNVINSLAFSPDGRRLATASDDHTVRVWDAATGQELLELRGHTGSVLGVAFSPDGTRLVSGGRDGTLRFWEATPPPALD